MNDPTTGITAIFELDPKHQIAEKVVGLLRKHPLNELHAPQAQLKLPLLYPVIHDVTGDPIPSEIRAKILTFFTPYELQRSRERAAGYLERRLGRLREYDSALQGRNPTEACAQHQALIREKEKSREPLIQLGALLAAMQKEINSPGVPKPKTRAKWRKAFIALQEKAGPDAADLMLRTSVLLLPDGKCNWRKTAKQLRTLEYRRCDQLREIDTQVWSLKQTGQDLESAKEWARKASRDAADVAALDAIAEGVREIYRTAFLAERLEAEQDLLNLDALDAQMNDIGSTLSPAGLAG